MGVGGVGPGNQPVEPGSGGEDPQGPTGPDGGGGPEGPHGPEGGPEGGDFGGEFGFDAPPELPQTETEALAAQQLCNTIAMHVVQNTAARGDIVRSGNDSTRADQNTRVDTALQQDSDTFRADSHVETRHDTAGEALLSGDRHAITNFFNKLVGTASGDAKRPSGNPSTTPNQPQPQPTGTPLTARPTGEGTTGETGTPTPPTTATPTPPTATPTRATMSPQARLDQLQGRLASMPPGPQRDQAQALETRLRAAIASGNDTEAAQIMEQISAMGIELGGEEPATETTEDSEVTEGEGLNEGEGTGGEGGVTRRGKGGEAPVVRLASTRFGSESLAQGFQVFSGGGGASGEQYDFLTRARAGIETIRSGRGTEVAARLSTDDAVRGVLDDGNGGDDSAGGGGSRDSSVEFGSLVDTDGALASGGMRLDTAAAGIGGSYGVRTEDGRFIPQWMAMAEHGGLAPGVRAAIARDASLRTRFGAEAISGARAERTGDLFAGARC